MSLTTGTVYRCKVQIGQEPAPCADEIRYLRWDGKRWRDHEGKQWLDVHSARPAKLHTLPPEWKEVLASEVLDRGLRTTTMHWTQLNELRAMFPSRRRR